MIKDSIELKQVEFNDLSDSIKKLIATSIEYLDVAYAPYSNFHVGAAVKTKSGKIFGGSNQENAAYPSCMCGERVALYHACAASPNDDITDLAITVRNPKMKLGKPVFPCGACRQVILEFEQRSSSNIALYIRSDDGIIYFSPSASALLLPYHFGQEFLI